jgi:hypothetical protein
MKPGLMPQSDLEVVEGEIKLVLFGHPLTVPTVANERRDLQSGGPARGRS